MMGGKESVILVTPTPKSGAFFDAVTNLRSTPDEEFLVLSLSGSGEAFETREGIKRG